MSFGYDDGTNTGGYGDDPTQQFGTPTSDGNEGSGPTAYEPGDDPSTQFGTPQSDQPGPTADDAGSPSDATQSFGSPTAWGDDAAPSTPPAQPRRSSADDYSYGPADPTQQFGTPYVSPQDYNNYFEDGGDNPVFNERQMRQDAAARGDLPQLPGAAEDTSNFNQASGWEANADQQTKSVMADDDSNRRAAYAPQPSNFDPDSELDPSQVIDWRGQQGPFRPGVPASERFGFEATDPTQMFGTPSNGEQTEFGPGDTRYDPPYTGGTAAGGAAKSVGLDENYQSTKAAADAIDVPGYKTEGASLHGEDSDLNRRWQDYVFGVENGMQEPDPQFEASIQGEANDLQSRFDDYRNRGAQYGQTFDAADTATGAYKDALDARAAQADQQGRADLQNFEDYSAIAQQPLGNQISPEQGGAIGAELLAGTRGSAVEGPPEPGMESLPDPNDPQAVRSAFEQQYPNSGATAALYDADGTPNGLAGEYLNRIEAQMGQQRADWLAAHPEQVPDAQTPGVVKPFEDFIFGSPMVGGVVPTSFLALAGLGIGGGAAALAGNSLISVSAPAAFKAAFLDGLPDHISIPDFVPGVGGRDIQTPDAAQHLLGAILDNPTGLLQTASNALTTLLDHPEQFPSQIAGDVKGAFTQSPTEYAVQQGLQDAGVLSLAAGVIGLHNPVSAVQTDGWSGVKDLIANTFQVHNTAKNFEDQVNQAVSSGASVQDAVTAATANIHNPVMDTIWEFAPWNPLYEAVTFPVFEEALKGLVTRKTAGAIENLTKRTGDFTQETGASGRAILAERTGANPASALFDTSRQAAAKQLADLQISHLPTVQDLSEMPELVARLFRGAEDIARNPGDYRYARAVAQQIADWSGGTAEGNLAHMKAIVVGETKSLLDQNAPGLFNRTVDRLAPVAEVLARKAAALEEGGGLSTRQIAEAAWGARLATSDPRALGLAARKLVADDITAAWYAHAGVDLPGTETQLARAYNGLFSLTRSLLLAGAAPPLALQKFTDEYGRAAIRGVFGIRAADTGLGQAGASFLADRGVGRAAAFRDGGTVRQLLDAGIAPDEALLRGQRAPYGIANAFTGTNRYGELMTKMDRAAALAGSLPRALDKWNQSLISAPTQHVMLNAAYQDLKGLAPARERLAGRVVDAIGTRTGDWNAAVEAGDRLSRARSEEQFLREAAAIDAKYPGLGVTKAAEPTVPVRNIAQGAPYAPSPRVSENIARTGTETPQFVRDVIAGGTHPSWEDVEAHLASTRGNGAPRPMTRERFNQEYVLHSAPPDAAAQIRATGEVRRGYAATPDKIDLVRGHGNLNPVGDEGSIFVLNRADVPNVGATHGGIGKIDQPARVVGEVPLSSVDPYADLSQQSAAPIGRPTGRPVAGTGPDSLNGRIAAIREQLHPQVTTLGDSDYRLTARNSFGNVRYSVERAPTGTGAWEPDTSLGASRNASQHNPGGRGASFNKFEDAAAHFENRYGGRVTLDAPPMRAGGGDLGMAAGDGGAGYLSRQQRGIRDDLNAAGGFGTGRTLDRYESMKGAPRSGPQAANDAAARIQRDAMDQHLNQSGTLDAYLDTLKANRNLDEVRAAGVGVNTEISNAEHFLAAAKSPADEARAAHDLAEFTKARREIGTLREELQPGYVSGASKEPTFGPAPRSATAADMVKARMDELGIQPTVPSTMRTPGIGKNADLRHDFAGYEGTVDPTQQFGRPAAADPTQAFGTPASFAPIQRNPFGPAERAAVTPASNGAGDITRQLGRQFATEQRGAAAAGVARGRSIVGNPLDQTTAGAFLKNGAGIIPPILPFAPFHIHSTQFWAGYFASHPAMALGIANAVAGLDDYGTLHLPGGATVGNLIKLTTGAHLVEWAKKAYEYQMDVARQGNNNPLQQVLKGIAYNTAGNNAFVRPFEWAGTPLEGFAQSHTNPLVTGKQNYDGTAQVDPRDVYRQSGGMTGLEGALQLANGRLGEPLPRNAVGAIGNPGKLLGNATQAGVNRLVGATIKQSDFGAQLPYFAPGFKEQQGWDLPRTQQAVKDALSGKPSSPDGRALLDAYNHNRDIQAVAKLAPVQLGQDESVKPIYPPFEKSAGFGTHSPNLPGSLYVNRQEWPQTRGFDSAQTNTAYGLLRSSDPGVVQSGADYLKQHGATIPARFDVTNMNDIDAQQIRQGRLDAQLRTDTQLGHPALNTDLGGGFTARDLLNQKGNYYATDKLLQDAYASGDKAAIARYTADLARIKAADIQQAPGLADYFKGLKENYAATHPDAPKPFRDTLAPNEQDAWDAFNDLRNSADYKARNSLEDQASGLTKGTKEYTDWFKKNGDELTRLNNIVNAGEQSILDLHGANPKELQNRLARSEGKPATYPDTTIPGQKAPFTPTPSSGSGARTPASSTSSRSGTGTSGSRAATTNRSPSGTTGRTNNSRTGSGSGGGSSSRPAAADAGTQFYSEYRNLTPQEKAVARNDPRVRDVIGAKGVTPAQFAQASQALSDMAAKPRTTNAPAGQTPRTAPQDASTGYRNLGGGYLRDADILAGRGADISRQIAEGHIPAGLLEAAMAHTAGGDPTTAARYAYDLQQRYGSPRPAPAPKGKRPQAA